MPRKTSRSPATYQGVSGWSFNEAAARCRGKRRGCTIDEIAAALLQ